jgi:hypothetical protein
MDRRLIFPAVAITAWAQQPSPAAAEAEATLRERVRQFYQLQVDKKFRQGEVFVAEDSKDDYYNSPKPEIRTFEIQGIEMFDENTRAQVTVKRRTIVRNPQIGILEFDLPNTTTWKIEDGQWVWHIDHNAPHLTPFGPIAPANGAASGSHDNLPEPGKADLADLMRQVTIDSSSVVLSSAEPERSVTLSNALPGVVTLQLTGEPLTGIAAELDKTELKTGEKAVLRFRLTSDTRTSGIVHVTVSPLNKVFDIAVGSK